MEQSTEQVSATQQKPVKLLGIRVTEQRYKQFKATAALRGKSMQDLLEDILVDYLPNVESTPNERARAA